jgi:hypothetical protein
LSSDVHTFFRGIIPEAVVVQPCFLIFVLSLEAERDKTFITAATSDFAVSFQFYLPNLVAPGIIDFLRGAKIIISFTVK